MSYVALLVLIFTAASGLVILGAWFTRGNVRRARDARGKHRRLPPALVFGHVGMAVVAATVWVVFVFTETHSIGWVSLAFILVAASLGITMFIRWVPTYRRVGDLGIHPGMGPGAAHRAPPVRNLPIAAVVVHGLFAVTTLVLVVLTLV